MNKTNKCNCGKAKKPWFPSCWECTEKKNKTPIKKAMWD